MASLGGIYDNGVMGLMAQSQAIGSISDNIANLQTTAYKRTNTLFSTLLGEADTLSGNTGTATPTRPTQQNGVASMTRQLVTMDGSIHATQNPFDLAISGPGMFVFANISAAANSTTFPGSNPKESFVYGRAGDLQELVPTSLSGAIPSANGANQTNDTAFLANKNGQFLMALAVPPSTPGQPTQKVSTPTSTASLVPVQVSSQAPFPGKVTSGAALSAVIPASNVTSVSAPMYYFDSAGVKQPLTITWSNPVAVANAGATWNVSVTDGNGQPVTGVAPTTMSFDNTGKAVTKSITITALSTATAAAAAGTSNTTSTTGTPAGPTLSTTFSLDVSNVQMLGASSSSVALATNTNLTQDGLPAGAFQGIKINQDGTITGEYAGGASQILYQIPIALFASPNNLQALAGNVYAPTQSSGAANFKLPGNGVAPLQVGALEESNVDLATEFSTMILTQQAYGASTQVLKVADQMSSMIAALQT